LVPKIKNFLNFVDQMQTVTQDTGKIFLGQFAFAKPAHGSSMIPFRPLA